MNCSINKAKGRREQWKKVFVCMLLVCCIFRVGYSQKIEFDHINSNDGVSSDEVLSLLQDSQGFLWILTKNGIDRYDGYEVNSLKKLSSDCSGIQVSDFYCADEDRYGQIWFGSRKFGILKHHIKTKKTGCIDLSQWGSNKVLSVLCDSKDRVWIGTSAGLIVYRQKTKEYSVFKSEDKKGGLPDNYIQSLYEDRGGNIWIGTWGKGLCRYNEQAADFETYNFFKVEDKNSRFESNRINTIYEDTKGYLWVGAWQAGVFVLDKSTLEEVKVIRRFKPLSKEENPTKGNIAYTINQDNEQNIWLGTPYGLNIVKNAYADEPEMKRYFVNRKVQKTISNNEVLFITKDNSGNMWLATDGGGVNKVDLSRDKFQKYKISRVDKTIVTQTVRAFLLTDEKKLYIGVNSLGFGEYDVKERKFVPFWQIPVYKDLQSNVNTVECFHQDNAGNIWMGTKYNGLIRHNTKNNEITTYNRLSTRKLHSRKVNCVVSDKLGQVWIGASEGVYLLRPAGFDYSVKTVPGVMAGNSGNYDDYVNTLLIDDEDVLWVGTMGGGLLRSVHPVTSKKKPEFKAYRVNEGNNLENNNIQTLFQDSEKRMWVGTSEGGFYLFDKKAEVFKEFHKSSGLYADIINDILEDWKGNLWLSTNKGLYRFTYTSENSFRFINYTIADGLQGNFFNKGAAYADKDGLLYFGGHYGFNIINPDEVKESFFTPPVSITKVKVLNREVELDPEKDRLVLSHADNYFSINFTALSFSNPKKNKFAFMLEGLDNDWRYTGANNRSAYYTGLKAGTYLFKVKASNSHGFWNQEPKELAIVVRPAPYKTWWAISIYILIVFMLIFLVFRVVIERVKMRQALEIEHLERMESEKVNQFKLRFFTNISHELLTPLTIISSLVEKEGVRFPGEDDFNIIRRNIKGLQHLIRQLLEFRKVETGSLTIEVKERNLSRDLDVLAGNFIPLAEKKGIDYLVETGKSMSGWCDIDVLEKILHNVLSNAFKYTSESGKIKFAADVTGSGKDKKLEVSIADNGCGISEEELKYIFDRFYRLGKEKKSVSGSGIGLALTKSLVDAHHGKISVESPVGVGTTFFVTIPLSASVYTDEEISLGANGELAGSSVEPDSILTEEMAQVEQKEWDVDGRKKHKVLIVEDNADFRQILKGHLEKEFIVKTAGNGTKALELLTGEYFELVVSDVMMPEMDGVELCSKIKESIETSHIPVILLTARVTEKDKQEGYYSGADSYLTKPVNLELLHTRIVSLIKSREKLREAYKDTMTIIPEKKLMSVDEEFLAKAKQIVLDNISNSGFGLKDLYTGLGTSNSTLYRKLTSLTGLNPNEFIKKIKLKKAAQLLKVKGTTVSEVMYQTGYNDLSYFGVCFKKEFGKSPSEYMKRK